MVVLKSVMSKIFYGISVWRITYHVTVALF
jgi:hypothetical protein